MNRHLKYIIGIFIITNILPACEVDDPVLENAEELITTFRLELTPQPGGEVRVFEFQDPDGEGGYEPLISADTLNSSTTYNALMIVLNEASSPVIDVAEEVMEEGDEHQFFFLISDIDVQHFYADEDVDGNPIGLANQFVTMSTGGGELKVILRHEPDKLAEGVMMGDISLAGGSTDLEVVFPLVVR